MKPFNLLAVFFSFLILISTGPVPGHAQDSGEPLFTADLGVQTYTFRNVIPEKGVEATLDIIQEMGFTEIEGGPAGGLSPEEFRKLLLPGRTCQSSRSRRRIRPWEPNM